MYKIMGVIRNRKNGHVYMKLKFLMPNGSASFTELIHNGDITYGTIVSTMVAIFGVNPDDLEVSQNILDQLPIIGV